MGCVHSKIEKSHFVHFFSGVFTLYQNRSANPFEIMPATILLEVQCKTAKSGFFREKYTENLAFYGFNPARAIRNGSIT